MKPGITNVDIVVAQRQALITLFQDLNRVLLIGII
jgi:hypothetical protein